MAKKQDKSGGAYMKDARKHSGKQEIVKVTDYGAREMFAETDNPSCVKGYVGPQGEFARYKHRETK